MELLRHGLADAARCVALGLIYAGAIWALK